jgi:sigma-B regulation protein RsbU (phosphoserine phosphatase)
LLAESLEDWQAKYGVLMHEQIKTATEKLKFEKDLKLAREIQQNIFPSGYPAFPEYPEIDLYAALKPAESIGGDLYDYFFIDQDHLLLAIGDVAGKGIPASLFMAIASTMIKNKAKVLSSKEIVAAINNELGDRNPNQYFLTLFLGVLDIRTGVIDYCNAAHNHPYILQSDGKVQVLPKSHGLPLGIYANKNYKSSTYKLNEGDLIVFFTDGVINARNEEGIHYGNERFEAQIQEKVGLSSKLVVTQLLQEIANYEEGTSQSDDITLMVFRFHRKEKNQA